MLVLRKRVGRIQPVIGALAGLISVGGFVWGFLMPASPRPVAGDVVVIVRDAKTRKPVPEATVEILSGGNAIVTTGISRDDGRVQRSVREGDYTLRVTRPGFAPETRKVKASVGSTSEVHVTLSPAPPARKGGGSAPPDAVNQGVGAVKKFIRDLGN
jgi:hypothetical protein